MIEKILDIIKMHQAEKLMNKINRRIGKQFSLHWSCCIKKRIFTELCIEYNSYENWKVEELVGMLKMIRATCTKHSLSMYFHRNQHTLDIAVNIG